MEVTMQDALVDDLRNLLIAACDLADSFVRVSTAKDHDDLHYCTNCFMGARIGAEVEHAPSCLAGRVRRLCSAIDARKTFLSEPPAELVDAAVEDDDGFVDSYSVEYDGCSGNGAAR